MGKSKKKLHKGSADTPTGLQSIRDLVKEEEDLAASPAAVDPIPSVIESIFEKFQSASVEDKECGCYILGNLAEQKEAIDALLQHDVIKIAASLLVDPSDLVRHSSAAALRNLSSCGGDEMCEGLMHCDVMTPLVALLKQQYPCGWEVTKAVAGKLDSKSEAFIEAVHLLSNLCESSGSAVRIFNQEGLATLLIPCLDAGTYNFRIAIAVGQCLHAVSEDNERVWEILNMPSHLDQLRKLATTSTTGAAPILLRSLSSGIILNMFSENLSQCSPLLLTTMMTGLSKTLSTNLQPLLTAVIDKMEKSSEDEYDESTNLSRDSLTWLVQSQQVALEVLTNLCCGIDEKDDGWEDVESSDNSEEIYNSTDVIMDDSACREKCPISIPHEVHEAIVSLGILSQMVSIVGSFPDTDVLLQTPAGHQFSQSFTTLCCRTLLCVNNMINCLALEEIGGSDYLYDMWVIVAKLAFKEVNKDKFDSRLVESATSAMRSVIQRLAEAQCKRFQKLESSDIQMVCDLLSKCGDTNTCVNVVHILGTLGWLMGNVCSDNAQTPQLIKMIGVFLLDMCSKDVALWVEAEALDALFDVFSEDHLDAIAADINLVERLKGFLPRLRHKIKSYRGNLGEHTAIIQTTKTNLDRFLKYKMENVPRNS